MKLCPNRKFSSRFLIIINLLFLLCAAAYSQPTASDSSLSPDLTQDAAILEKKIRTYNRDFCPPRNPIKEISNRSLLKLVNVELLERNEIERFLQMKMVDGKVISSGLVSENAQNLPGNNLLGDLQASCEELQSKNTRGQSAGNKKPEKTAKLKLRKVKYRDRDNQLHEMDVYSPPKLKAKKRKKVKGRKGKKVKDFATTKMLQKNTDKDDSGNFNRMPSADSWVDED